MRPRSPASRSTRAMLVLLLSAAGLGMGCPRAASPQTPKRTLDRIPWISSKAFLERIRAPQGPVVASKLTYINEAEGRLLASLAQRSQNIFEFGTGRGHTTLLLAKNSPEGAKTVTITLPPTTRSLTRRPGDSSTYTTVAIDEVHRGRFAYEGTPERHKIEQIFLDSKKLDETKHLGRYDLVFVDGAHVYSFVKSDSEKALRMIRKGGVIVWHDYHPKRADVVRYLVELAAKLKLYRVVGTQSVVYFHE